MSEYDEIVKGPLKLKSGGVQKSKKKNKHNKKLLEQVSNDAESAKEDKVEVTATKAEIAFQKMQEKMQKERILQKASMTHKQRVEEFNRHLDSLTEHFDIPKVSWTK
ncbi:protein FAM32A-like [Homalodisca vitripennis]|uniref:protein FAM32A-like n=1 Tax=Homalodisca vitripennis TaxID=197043 RepID=UPI001EECC942|nr:protein FAM32A-like [Homalodisca vitripennis]XP_046671879.1 protein FAM32A-like [Homalodisca vitripennis]XP_046686256.1 protein FAM32A-like [Homalodisca vitripennis]